MRLFQSLSRASLSLTAMLAMTSASQAVIVLGNGDTVNLGALMATGSDRKFIVDDKMFTFKYVTTPNFDIQQFDITGYISASTNQYGLRNVGFDMTGPFVDGGVNDLTVQDMNLNYTVEILPEFFERGVRLSDTRLAFNGSAAGTGSFARVAETVFETDTGNLLGNMNVFSNAGPPPSEQLSEEKDWAAINQNSGYRSFELNKNIKMFANTAGGFAVCSFVRQDFSQIPSPGAFALLGFAGAVAGRRRKA